MRLEKAGQEQWVQATPKLPFDTIFHFYSFVFKRPLAIEAFLTESPTVNDL